MLGGLLTDQIFAWLLVFARVGGGLMVMPGFGDGQVNMRVRLVLALAISLVVAPVVQATLPGLPDQPMALLLLIAGEILIGVFLGTLAKLLTAALEVAGQIISFQIGLAAAQAFNPALTSQGTLLGVLFGLVGILLVFVTDLHHLMIRALVDSYAVFPAGTPLPAGDAADVVSRALARSFEVAVQFAAPSMVVGLIFYMGLGIISRLIPNIQVFFIGIPAQMLLGMTVLSLTLSAVMFFWLRKFEAVMIGIVPAVN